jgi:CRISPR/Cas system-associated exonuclease Cas4 (RecB family)
VKGIKTAPTAAMMMGAKRHSILEVEHKERSTEELSVDDALEKAKVEKVLLVAREISVEWSQLKGKIDEIHFMHDQIIIVDDKPNSVAWDSNKVQVWGYCLAFQEQFRPMLPISALLRHRDTQRTVWEEVFTEDHRDRVLIAIERISGIMNGEREPEPTDNINKCRRCSLNNVCDGKRRRF